MIVNLDSELKWIYDHHGNTPLSLSMKVFPESFT